MQNVTAAADATPSTPRPTTNVWKPAGHDIRFTTVEPTQVDRPRAARLHRQASRAIDVSDGVCHQGSSGDDTLHCAAETAAAQRSCLRFGIRAGDHVSFARLLLGS